jgi:hypothetical protein
MIDFKSFEDILQCPITKEKLEYCDNIQNLSLYGNIIRESDAGKGYVNKSGSVFYPVNNDIIYLLPECAITSLEYKTDEIIQSVKSFYDRFGWKKEENDQYNDNKLFVSNKEVVLEYETLTTKRVDQFLENNGTYMLDIASGAVYQNEYQEFSKNFFCRICIDISITALKEAQENLKGQNAIFILGDITNIPLKNESCDCVLSMHTLYHVPKLKQAVGMNELVRVCKVNSNIVIAYNWGWHSILMNFALFPIRMIKVFIRIRKVLFKKSQDVMNNSTSGLYFYSHGRRYFAKHKPVNSKISFYVLRSLHQDFIRLYLSDNAGSLRFLNRIYKLENKCPIFFGKHGAFPLIILKKTFADK